MLFSRKDIADVINTEFEPVWKMVRPVPIIRIDFGNGKKLTRTLHGNIATYICLADGTVVDILPGVYDPVSYRQQLLILKNVAKMIQQGAPRPEAALSRYHDYQQGRLEAIEALKRTGAVNPVALLDVTKSRIEGPTEVALKRRAAVDKPDPVPSSRDVTKAVVERPTELAIEPLKKEVVAVAMSSGLTTGTLSKWPALLEDTRHNELIRRKLIHGYLKDKGVVKPETITKWLYREVLNTDLDDPYLGLEKALFGSYPFGEEDATD